MSPPGQAVAHGRTARLTRPEVPDGGGRSLLPPNQPAVGVSAAGRRIGQQPGAPRADPPGTCPRLV